MRALVLVTLLACAACIGPYPNLAEKFDLGPTIGGEETSWLLASDTETQVLVLAGIPAGQKDAVFVLAHVNKHGDANVRSGQWELAADGTATLFADLEQERLNEAGTPVISQRGSTRKNINDRYVNSSRTESGKLILSGDPRVAGTWSELQTAFSLFATYDGQRAAECSLRFAQIAILLSQARVPGFGGPASIQYSTPATFKGTLAGTLVVNVDGLLNPRTTLTYAGFTDQGGFTLDKTIITQTDSGGNGTLFSAVAPTYTKAGAAQPLWSGTITFGQEDGSGDTLTLAGGVVTGGKYHVDDSSGGHYVFPYTDILETNVLNGCFSQ